MSRLARQRRSRARRPGAKILGSAIAVLISVLVIGAAAGVAYVMHFVDAAPALSALHPVVPGPNSQIFASDGTPLGFIQSDVLRSPVSWNQIPDNLKNATVAIEDQRFYKHGGVDLQGIARSAIKDVASGKTLQGASTIAMQLVRNLYLPASQRSERSLKRKIIEAVEADRLEKRYSKQWILLRYLNSVPYGTVGGQNAIGVQAAARVFFNKTVAQLDLAECALLAGLPQAPSSYNPFLDRGTATQRRNDVLTKMAALHYISPEQAASAIASPIRTRHTTYYNKHRESAFFDYVTQQLIDVYGPATVTQGGLRVYTTINLKLQNQARAAIATELNQPGDPSSAVVTEDPHTGYILAMAQSAGDSQFNLASQARRQPGSTFKAIDLATALARGVDPNSTSYVSHTLEPGWLPTNPTYKVQTFENTSINKPLNLVAATLASDNTIYAQLAADLGQDSITQMAYRMGVREHLDSYPAEALGGLHYGVTPLEMANVFATLADGGYRNTQISIKRVVFADGHTDNHWGIPRRAKVLSDGVTSEETNILTQNVQSGTAVRSAIGCPTAAKTGTTSNLYDAWLDGYTPDFSTVVWIGYPNRDISMTSVHGQPQQGGYIPAQIWHDYMSQVVGTHCTAFPPPAEAIQYSPFSGTYVNGGGPNPGGSTSTDTTGTGGGSDNGGSGATVVPTPSPAPKGAGNTHRGAGGGGGGGGAGGTAAPGGGAAAPGSGAGQQGN